MERKDVKEKLPRVISRDGGTYISIKRGLEIYVTDECEIIFEEEYMTIFCDGYSLKLEYRLITSIY